MNMISTIFFILFPFFSYHSSDGKEGLLKKIPTQNSWTEEELSMANTAKNVTYLTQEEKNIVFYMNLIRIDGTKFLNTYFQDFITSNNRDMQNYSNYQELKIDKRDRYYRGLELDLKTVKGLSLYYPDESLSYVSKLHGIDMNKHNLAGHNSWNGRTAIVRINKFYPNKAMAENLAFGFSKGLANVCMLLLDKGVPDLGHRKNMLNTALGLNLVGVSIQPHPAYRYSATIDFVAVPNLNSK